MTIEQMLKAIIEAQVRGGYVRWDLLSGLPIDEYKEAIQFRPSPVEPLERYSILEILLTPEGLKAAYGTSEEFYRASPVHGHIGESLERWHWVARGINEAWLSGGAEKAIKMAYERLSTAPILPP